ncbi:MAG: HEAT repeat domain-containing protein [Verrucomicrobiia bacterium]
MKNQASSKLTGMINVLGALAVVIGLLSGSALLAAESNAEKEQALIAVLKSNAGQKEKADACRELAVYGTKASVPVLAPLLEDEKLSHMARYALEPIQDPSVDEAFRNALKKVNGRLLVGVIGSIGVRRDVKAIDALAAYLNDQNAEVAQAAARALGSIGTTQSAKVLQAALAKAPSENVLAICEGLFRCAESLAAAKQTKEALAIYDMLRDFKNAPHQVTTGAVRGSILLRPQKESLALLEKSLKSQDYLIFSAAVRTALEMKGQEVGRVLASVLTTVPADNQIEILNAIAHRGDAVALPEVIKLSLSGNKTVRIAAIKAMGSIGQDKALPELVNLTTESDSDVSKTAQDTLAGFAGKGADAVVLNMLKDSDVSKKLIGIDLVARRRIINALPTLIALTSDNDSKVRQSALKRIADVGSVSDIDLLIGLLKKSESDQDISAIEQSLSAICARAQNQDLAANKIIAAFSSVGVKQKGALLHILSAIGNQTALAAVREAVKDTNQQVRNEAIRALGDWKTADAVPDLIELARTAQNNADRTLCLRNFFRLTGQAEIPVNQRLGLCKKAAEITNSPEEKKMLLGALGNITAPEALDLILPMLSDESTANEAGAAVVSVATRLLQNKRNLNNQKIIQALQKTATAKVSENISKQASALLEKTKKQ